MSTSEQYFHELAARLKRLPPEEREAALDFYREFAQESGLTDAAMLTERFGPPRALASKILAESAVKTADSARKGGVGRAVAIALAALFTLPVTFPVAIAVILLLLVLAILVLAAGSGLAVTLYVLGRVGIELLLHSFTSLVPLTAAMWMKLLGAGLILAGGAAGVLGLIVWLVRNLLKKLTVLISKTVERSNHHAS